MSISKILLPFGTASTGMLILNVIMYCIVIFLAVFLPVYFLVINSKSSGSGQQNIKLQMQIASIKTQIAQTNSSIANLTSLSNLTSEQKQQLADLQAQLVSLNDALNLLQN